MAVDGDVAAIKFVEPGQQIDDGGFAGAGGAHEGDCLPGFGLQGDAVEGGGFAGIGEDDVGELHVALGEVEGGPGFRIGLGGSFEDIKNPVSGSAAGLEDLVQGVQAPHRFVEKGHQEKEPGEFPRGDALAQHRTASEIQHQHRAEGADEVHAGVVE